ncbi:MAG: hypothetical protein Q4G10_05245 [Bacteroidia bacterium]|nr:hypothetical protein [Bacteroidia bacterium]
MKQRLIMLSLSALVSCLGTGCKIGDCREVMPCGHASFNISVVDLVILPVALTVMMGNELYLAGCQCCENLFYDYPGTWESRSRCWERLHNEWSGIYPQYKCYSEFDEAGARSEEFYVFTILMDDEDFVRLISREDAYRVARWALDNPSLMEWIPKLWLNKNIEEDYRNQALDRLRYRKSTDGKLFEMILDHPCYTEGKLEKIMQTTPNEHESRAAYKILCARVGQDKSK